MSVIQVPSFALLTARVADQARSGWLELRDAAEHFNILGDEDLHEAVQVWLRPDGEPSSGPLVIGNPTADLEASSNEAVTVGGILGVEPLLGPEATVAAVRSGFAKSPLVHIAAHARFDPYNPLQSSLRLADVERRIH